MTSSCIFWLQNIIYLLLYFSIYFWAYFTICLLYFLAIYLVSETEYKCIIILHYNAINFENFIIASVFFRIKISISTLLLRAYHKLNSRLRKSIIVIPVVFFSEWSSTKKSQQNKAAMINMSGITFADFWPVVDLQKTNYIKASKWPDKVFS